MNRETRANLIFISLLLAVMIPPAYITIKKKLDPDARRMGAPDVVPHQAAYIDYNMQRPGIERIAPPKTCAWVAELADKRWRGASGDSIHPEQRREGLPSEKHTFEVAAVEATGEGVKRIGLIAWDPEMSINPTYCKFMVGENPMKVTSFDQIGIPPDVRHELQKFGFVNPPKLVGWYELGPEAAGVAAVRGDSLRVVFITPRGPRNDRWLAGNHFAPPESPSIKEGAPASADPATSPTPVSTSSAPATAPTSPEIRE
ncbi:MAG: hypothetical protein NTW19_06980 [Planctomycetota bacterium]|nr:hypothetical protein [Planctomycetota bacterium]